MIRIQVASVSNVWLRMMTFEKAGDVMKGHTHPYDHITLLAKGSVRVTVNGKSTDFKAPHAIWIAKENEHEIVALEDDTFASCIHAVRYEGVPDIVDPDMIPEGAHPQAALRDLDNGDTNER